jgi:hypothetical protein
LTTRNKDFGVVILLDALGTRQRLIDDIDKFLVDWDSVLKRLEENVTSRSAKTQNRELSFRCIAYNMHRLTNLVIIVWFLSGQAASFIQT